MQCSKVDHLYQIVAVNQMQIYNRSQLEYYEGFSTFQDCHRCGENLAEYRLKMGLVSRKLRDRRRLKSVIMENTSNVYKPTISHSSCRSEYHSTFLCHDCILDEYCMAEIEKNVKCMMDVEDVNQIEAVQNLIAELDG